MCAEGSKNIPHGFSKFISDSITSDMLLEDDGNFGVVINGIDIHPDSTHLSQYDILVQAAKTDKFSLLFFRQLGIYIQ